MKVFYHTEGNPPLELDVLKKNDDKTVDIGEKGKDPIVTNAQILDAPKFGYCTAIAEEKPTK